jgi:hypothetical protein
MSSKRAAVSFFVIGGIILGGGVAGLPLFAKANKWDGGEFMVWLEESKMNRIANRFFAKPTTKASKGVVDEEDGED